jgi:hypothetical protein
MVNQERYVKRLSIDRIFLAILALAVLLRIYICFFSSLPNMHKDSFEYYNQADALLKGGYVNYFPNGYPMLIALVKLLSAEHSIGILLWLNIIMSASTIWFIYFIGIKLSGRASIGLAAAAILAIFPSQINYVRWLTTEVPTHFLLLGAFFFYYRKQFGWSGLFFGLAIIVRTNVAPVFLLLIVVELFFQRRLRFFLLAGTLLPILFVGFYCKIKTGSFSISGNNRDNILYSVTASGSYINYHLGEERPDINTEAKAVHLYFAHLKNEPIQFLKQRLANSWELWGFYASSANGSRTVFSRLVIGAGNFLWLFLDYMDGTGSGKILIHPS